MPPKLKIARTVRPNLGIEMWYRGKLRELIKELNRSYLYWIQSAYNQHPPVMATDATPSEWMRKKLSELGQRWMKKINDWAPKIAESYVSKIFKASDSAFRKTLAESGWSVKFQMTEAMKDAFNASLTENIGLIKSIPQQFHDRVAVEVMRSYSTGRDLETMVGNLKKLYPAASHRAVLISRDQSNKANAVVNRTRQLELGITKAIWMHSHAGKEPRPSHVAANGKEFDVEKGMFLDGKWVLPGTEINCRCTSRSVLPI